MSEDTEHPDESSHEKNTTVEGPKGPMLAHYCEDSATGRPKPGSAERCPHCSVAVENMQDDGRGDTERISPDGRLTLNLTAEEREALVAIIPAGVDHLSHKDAPDYSFDLQGVQSSLLTKLQLQNTGEAKEGPQ